ncbi:MAG: copper-binding protein [Rhodobacteraceae bacterium]|nr:CopD family protein [Paracoccaceae bacterium]MYG43035.1 copper-binding protein [Paracoccaceae bacterium]
MDLLILLTIISKLTFYMGALFASGTVFYLTFFETNQARTAFNGRQLTIQFAAIGLVSALSVFALTGAQLTGDLAGVLDAEILGILFETPVGDALIIRVLGFSLIIIGFFAGKISDGFKISGSFIVLSSFFFIGHVGDLPGFLFAVLLVIHLAGIAIWVGILFPLYRLSSDPLQFTTTEKIAHQFGRWALYFVPILLIAGGWLAYKLVNSFENLFTTGYGQTLLVKVVIVTGLLGLAACNKLRFVPALRAGDVDALKHLKFSVLVEIILVFFILAVTAVLTSVQILPETHHQ